jgi:hypothetical protein
MVSMAVLIRTFKGCTYRAPIRYVTKTWNVVLLNKKNYVYSYLKCIVYDRLLKPRQSFRITLHVTALSPCYLDNVWRGADYSLWAHLVDFSVTSCAFRILIFIYSPQNCVFQLLVNGKAVLQSLDRPRGFQEVEASWFQDNRHLGVVRLSALRDTVEDSSILWFFFLSNGKCCRRFRGA